MKKAHSAMALGCAAALALSACGAAPEQGANSGNGAAGDFLACMVSDEGGFDDQSFNQSGREGLEKAEADLGVSIKTLESESAADYTTNIDSLIQQDCDIIFGVGFNLAADLTTAAQANPDVEFALIDATFADTAGDTVEVPNGKPLLFNTAESAYLAGYSAAAMSKSGTVATYGGRPIPTVQIFMEGFAKGVAKYNEDTGKSVKVLGWDPSNPEGGSFVGDFSNTAKGQALTNQFISQGADIIMPVAGPVGLGTLSTVKESSGEELVVWVDSDGFESTDGGEIILTSVVKEIGQSVYDTVKEASSGSYTAEPYIGTLDNNGVALSPFHDQDSKVPADVKAKIEELRKQIIDGTLDVSTPYDPS